MTDQLTPEQVPEQLVVCGTCDLVFRAHAGRQSCPTCGGDPAFAVMTLDVQPESADQDEASVDVPQAEAEVEPAQPPAPPAAEGPDDTAPTPAEAEQPAATA